MELSCVNAHEVIYTNDISRRRRMRKWTALIENPMETQHWMIWEWKDGLGARNTRKDWKVSPNWEVNQKCVALWKPRQEAVVQWLGGGGEGVCREGPKCQMQTCLTGLRSELLIMFMLLNCSLFSYLWSQYTVSSMYLKMLLLSGNKNPHSRRLKQ